MDDVNGGWAVLTVGRPKVYVLELDAGAIAHITPIAPAFLRRLEEQAAILFADPDDTQFSEPVPNSEPELELMTDGKDTVEWHELMGKVIVQRNQWKNQWLYDNAVTFPEGKDMLIRRFSDRLAVMKLAVPDLGEDNWKTLFHYMLTTQAEQLAMITAAYNRASVTDQEVTEAIRFFRIDLQRTVNTALAK